MALVYNEDEEKRGSLHYEEEAPPPAFQIDAQPSSLVHIPQPNSIKSIAAEVLVDNKGIPNKAEPPLFSAFNRNQNNQMMNMNGFMHQNNMAQRNMNPNQRNMMMPRNMPPNMNNGAPMMPIFSEEFMNNMLDMAANMDVPSMNQNMQKKIQNIQRSSNPKNHNQYNKPNAMQKMKHQSSSPNVFSNKQMPNINRPKSHDLANKKKRSYKKKVVPPKPPQHIIEKKQNHPPPPPQHHRGPLPPPQEEFDNPIQSELVSMGFDKEYVIRACNLYKKKFKNKPLRLEVLTEIIIRLQQRDQSRRGRSKSIDSIAGAAVAAPDPQEYSNHNRRRSSVQGKVDYNNNGQLQQSESYEYIQNNNDYHNKYGRMNNAVLSNAPESVNVPESIAVSVIMSSSSIGPQTCDIIIRKDQTLQDAKQLISTCLADFDQLDESYAFFHDDSGLIFDDFDITIIQMLQLMDINVEEQNIVLTLKIGRIISKYIKLK